MNEYTTNQPIGSTISNHDITHRLHNGQCLDCPIFSTESNPPNMTGGNSGTLTPLGKALQNKCPRCDMRWIISGYLINSCSCGNIQTCPLNNVKNVRKTLHLIKNINEICAVVVPVITIKKDIGKILKNSKMPLENGKNETLKNTENYGLDLVGIEDWQLLMRMEENVLVVEKQRKNSLPLTIRIMMEIENE